MLSDEKEPQKLTGKFVYSTQQLFLFYLYSKKKRLYISEAGKVLPFTAMTLTRAVKQLEATDLFLVAKDGVNKFIESKDVYKRQFPDSGLICHELSILIFEKLLKIIFFNTSAEYQLHGSQ